MSKTITFPFLASTVLPLLLDMQPVEVGGVVVHQEVLSQMSALAWGSKHSVGRRCWILLLVDFGARFGFHHSFIHWNLPIGKAMRRFRDLMLHVLGLHGCKAEAVTGIRALNTLGLGCNS